MVNAKSGNQDLQLSKLLLVSMLIAGAFVYQHIFGWFYLGGRHGFGDLQYVLDRVTCIKFGWNELYSLRTEEVCTGYIYGSTLLKLLSIIKVTMIETNVIAYLIIFIFTLIFIRTVSQNLISWPIAVFATVLFFSPPIILLFERLNIDLIIFLLVYCASSVLGKRLWLLAPTSLALATLFKFYTLPLLIFHSLNLRRRWIVLIALLLPTIVLTIIDLRRIQYLPWDARNMFGNAIWLEYVLYVIEGPYTHANFILASLMGAGLIICVGLILRKIGVLEGPTTTAVGRNADRIVFLLSTYTFCYFSGLSVDYRLVFLLFSYILAEQLFSMTKVTAWVLRTSIFMSFYLSYNVEILQPLGDFSQMVCLVILWNLSWKTGLVVFGDIIDKSLKIVRIVLARVSRNRH